MLDFFLACIIISLWIVISSYYEWWGGHSYGPRYFSDMIPFLIYFLIAAFADMAAFSGIKKICIWGSFLLLFSVSFLIHYRGATSLDVYSWNSKPIDINEQPQRVWDWNDLQFMRGIK